MSRIELADFLKECPEDHSPIAFFEAFRGRGLDKASLGSIYIALVNEALKSQDRSIVDLGREMRRQWNSDKPAVQKYWNENELESIQNENISKAARRASKLDNATGEYLLQKSLQRLSASPVASTLDHALILDHPTRAASPASSDVSLSLSKASAASASSIIATSAPKKNQKAVGPSPARISASTIERRKERYASELDESKFWYLSSGTCVERVLMAANLTEKATIKTRSFTIDFDSPFTKSLFNSQDWAELMKFNSFSLPILPNTTNEYILSLGDALEKSNDVASIALPKVDTEACEIVRMTFMIWARLYRKKAFLADLSESYWARKAWPLLYDLIEEIPEIFGLDGEKSGIESSRRKNQNRASTQDNNNKSGLERKRTGRKLDLIARDVLHRKDWFIVERMNGWDPHSSKYIRECFVDLFRETHTIATHRLQETQNKQFREVARFFAAYTGDRGFATFELRPAPQGYVYFFHQHAPFELPPTADDAEPHMQAVTHLLRIRLCLLETIRTFKLAPRNRNPSILYQNKYSRLDAITTLASSPLGPSPDHSPPSSPAS
ncbi:hypothetical protein BGX34_001668 [Mortierella sp. NVP85]|nr:hypothetical protein BGX34_001668 [Mortierella sp. NVP85]